MSQFREQKWRGFRIGPPVPVGGIVREVHEDHRIDASEIRLTTEVVSFCASCNRALVEPSSVGGVCAVCRQVMCSKCTEDACAICGRVVCGTADCSGELHGLKVCRGHTFFELVNFELFGKR